MVHVDESQRSSTGQHPITDGGHPSDAWSTFIVAACRRIEDGDPAPPLDEIARAVGISVSQLVRRFRKRLGVTPGEYAAALRRVRLAGPISEPTVAVDRMPKTGLRAIDRRDAASVRSLGLPPGRLRDAPCIDWWLGLSDLGWLLVAATNRGICWIAFGEDPLALCDELARAFPKARLRHDDGRLRQWFDTVREHVLRPERAIELPLDVQGTAFQARVWAALRRIPLGTTTSYSALADALGMPQAARAVAAACAANPVAVVVPSHRVVAADGALAGYRWGLWRKRALLGREWQSIHRGVGDAAG
jgi:AraC family transcriptional regulator of adaptative response/methylated-DNA-[protein]-cysteine methyltransferase